MRKSATVTISAEGRDKGKVFVLTELSAEESEEWAGRALFALMNAGVEVPDDIVSAGLAGMAALGLKALTKLSFEAAKPLFDKMMECVKIKTSASVERALIEDDIEEVQTRFQLRKEVLTLHMGFSMAAVRSTLARGAASPIVE
jgi:hypothetical protein